MELIMERQEMPKRSVVGIFLKRSGPFVVEVISNAGCGNKFQAAKSTAIIGVNNRIEDNVYGSRCTPRIGRTSEVIRRDSQYK